jgi:hypothetical protein
MRPVKLVDEGIITINAQLADSLARYAFGLRLV